MRVRFKGLLDMIGGFFNRIGLMPNTMTILGLVGNTIGAVLLARGYMTWGGLLILAMGPVDALDGTMARLRGEPSEFGAFVDSVTDRYSELIIFGGLLYFYAQKGDWLGALVAFAAAEIFLVERRSQQHPALLVGKSRPVRNIVAGSLLGRFFRCRGTVHQHQDFRLCRCA